MDVRVEEAALPPTGGNLSCDVRQIYRADGSECMGMTTAAASSGISPLAHRQERPARLPGERHSLGQDHPHQLRLRGGGRAESTIKVDDAATKLTWNGVPGAEMDPGLPIRVTSTCCPSTRSSTRT